MKIPALCLLLVIASSACSVFGFANQATNTRRGFLVKAEADDSSSPKAKETQTLGLLTFDLDDTLYPIDKVVAEANGK